MHVLFVEPAFPRNQREFVRALHGAGARVTAIGESPLEALPDELRHALYQYEQVSSVVDEPSLQAAVERAQEDEAVDRLEATVEAHILPVARVREARGIPGTSVRTAFLCRDKPAMKEALRQAGVACAESTGADSLEEARAFVERVGYPVIVKPRDAAGAAGTWLVRDDAGLVAAARESALDHGASVAVEEFVEGHEGFFDTITIGGEIAHHFVSHYYPNVLEAMRTRWISPQIVATNRLSAEGYEEVHALGQKVITALGINTSATHMEWFFGPKGLKFSEIGCRPPGVGAWDLYCMAHEMDVYREWAMAIVHERTSQERSCDYAAGLINLRPEGDGTITGYEGLEILDELDDAVMDHRLPPPGTPNSGPNLSYMLRRCGIFRSLCWL